MEATSPVTIVKNLQVVQVRILLFSWRLHSPSGFSILTVRTSTTRTLTAKVYLMVFLSTVGAVALLVRLAVSTRSYNVA